MAVTLLVIGALMTAVVQSARMINAMVVTMQDNFDAWSRFSLQVTNLKQPVPGVTVEIDPVMPPTSACQVYKLTTRTKAGRLLEMRATRGCIVQ